MLVPTGTLAQDFDEGLSAFQEGDYWTAFRNWHKLAGEGNMHAQNNLGWMYENGKGVPLDITEAARWYRLAAKQGDSSAQLNLGNFYYLGTGVAQDNISALKWWAIAAAQGDQDAENNGSILASKVSKNDLVQALNRARDCVQSNYTNCD